MPDVTYQIVVRKGPNPGHAYSLNAPSITIGRDPMSDIVLSDPEVSRYHARLTQTEVGYKLEDMKSTNGTFVDGERIEDEPAVLKPGQLLVFGSSVSLVYQEIRIGAEDDNPLTTTSDTDNLTDFEETAVDPSESEPMPGDIFDDEVEQPETSSWTVEDRDAALNASPVSEVKTERLSQAYEPTVPTPPPQSMPSYGGDNMSYGSLPTDEQDNTKRNVLIMLAIVLLLVCCCCLFLVFMWYWGGDWLLRETGMIP